MKRNPNYTLLKERIYIYKLGGSVYIDEVRMQVHICSGLQMAEGEKACCQASGMQQLNGWMQRWMELLLLRHL